MRSCISSGLPQLSNQSRSDCMLSPLQYQSQMLVSKELEKDGFGEVQTNKRRKAEGNYTSPKAANGIQEVRRWTALIKPID